MTHRSERARLWITRLLACLACLLCFGAPASAQTRAWVDEDLPVGAVPFGGEDGWNWTTSPAPVSGSRAHQSAALSGVHQHFFAGATDTLKVAAGDKLFAHVYLDPANLPRTVMLQWNDGTWEHRAYWGEDLIGWGVNGTASRRPVGALPAAGGWVRLEVPAGLVGLEGSTLNGMAFSLFDGRATWDSAGKAPASETVWVEDTLPAGAFPAGDGDSWTWVAANPVALSGAVAHQSIVSAGLHQHFFYGATGTLSVGTGESLFAYVYLDPANMPRQVMLQWNDGSWEHRAYWGENLIGWGVDGTNSRRLMGALPAGGGWVRLEVPASEVGLEGSTLNGMAFTLYGGRATWDRAGKAAAANETRWVEDAPPAGATLAGDSEGWNWTGANPPPFSGAVAHQSNVVAGLHQHFFYNASDTLSVAAGDRLFAYVYLDPANMPSEVMLQWNNGNWEHRAYWGANLLGWGVDGTASRRYMGLLPAGGGWVRLEVPASLVGLEGSTLNGMAFSLHGGRATWDSAGKASSAGSWSPPLQLPVVPIHSHLMPNGKVLFWSRDQDSIGSDVAWSTQAHLWNPADGSITQVFNWTSNLFCSGHAMLPDGRLLVAGGHEFEDLVGLTHTNVFNPADNTWTWAGNMNDGRWYPTTTTLRTGEVLVVSGTFRRFDGAIVNNTLPQAWSAATGAWRDLGGANKGLPLYPWMYQAPNGKVFYAGPSPTTEYLDITGAGSWSVVGNRVQFIDRGSGSSVMYGDGKVLVVGGGDPATNTAEIIDLAAAAPAWQSAASMIHPRTHPNATLLPDGRVLVTGGENGGGPVKVAELWDPQAGDPIPGTNLRRGAWTTMPSAAQTRVYHSTAILLPDGRVMAGGGGLPGTIYKDAEFYSPPYLFRGPRPHITSAPQSVLHNQTFFVGTPDANVARATLVRLPSVTHSFDMNQRFNDLTPTIVRVGGGLNLRAPANGSLCPPGHYMLFLINDQGVPSVAAVIRIG